VTLEREQVLHDSDIHHFLKIVIVQKELVILGKYNNVGVVNVGKLFDQLKGR
jgi:hypothetical protein